MPERPKPPKNGAGRPNPPRPKPIRPNAILGVSLPQGDPIPRAKVLAWIRNKVNPKMVKLNEEIRTFNKWVKKNKKPSPKH
jgi:hypothetical protein